MSSRQKGTTESFLGTDPLQGNMRSKRPIHTVWPSFSRKLMWVAMNLGFKKKVFRHSFCVLTFFTSQVSPSSSCTSPFSSRVAGADRLPSFRKTPFFETQGCFNPTDSCWTIAMTMIVIGFTIRYSYCKPIFFWLGILNNINYKSIYLALLLRGLLIAWFQSCSGSVWMFLLNPSGDSVARALQEQVLLSRNEELIVLPHHLLQGLCKVETWVVSCLSGSLKGCEIKKTGVNRETFDNLGPMFGWCRPCRTIA